MQQTTGAGGSAAGLRGTGERGLLISGIKTGRPEAPGGAVSVRAFCGTPLQDNVPASG